MNRSKNEENIFIATKIADESKWKRVNNNEKEKEGDKEKRKLNLSPS